MDHQPYTRRMTIPLRPALTAAEWYRRRFGAVSIDVVDAETHVAIRDPDGEVVTVSGDDELFALIALANTALSDDDSRKLCRKDLAVLGILIDTYRQTHGERQLLDVAIMLYDKLAALLPGTSRTTPPSGTDIPESR